MRQRRMKFFSHTGVLLGARPWLPWNARIGEGVETTVRPNGLLHGGLMVAHMPTLAPPDTAPLPPPHGTVGPLALADSTSTARDTIVWLAQASELFMLNMKAVGYLHFPGPNHFIDTPLWHVADDGTVIVVVNREAPASASRTGYRVRLWNGAGSRAGDQRIPFEPVAVQPWTVDSITEVFTDDIASMYPSKDVARRLVSDSLRPPAFYPPVTDVVVGTDGYIWLAREGLATPPFDRRHYDILDTGGKPSGRLQLSRPGRILAATATFVWAVEHDADDVPSLVRYPVIRSARTP